VICGDVRLSEIGEIVAEEWERTEQIRPNPRLDEWIIMPKHIHGTIII
jgi:REP element-mobilizing transposase RayT